MATDNKGIQQKQRELKQSLPLIIVIIVLLCDLASIFLFSALSASFDFSVLATGTFWAGYALTNVLVFVAYFALIFYGNFKGNLSDEIYTVETNLEKARTEINDLLLSGEMEKYFDSLNVISRCRAIVDKLDKKLRRTKDENKRLKIIDEKTATIYMIQLEEEKILERELSFDKIQDYKEFITRTSYNHSIYRFVKYRKINKRIVMSSKKGSAKEVGKFSSGTIIANETLMKMSFSMIGIFVLTALIYGTFKWDATVWINIVWRTMMVVFNAYMGYVLGYNMIVYDKVAALKERLGVFSVFKAYCLKSGLIVKD